MIGRPVVVYRLRWSQFPHRVGYVGITRRARFWERWEDDNHPAVTRLGAGLDVRWWAFWSRSRPLVEVCWGRRCAHERGVCASEKAHIYAAAAVCSPLLNVTYNPERNRVRRPPRKRRRVTLRS